MAAVSKDTKIGEIAMNYPEAVAVLMEHGFHCIGCGLAAYETVEEGAMAHGFDESEVGTLVKKMNDAIESSSRTTARPLLRQAAIDKAEKEKKGGAKEGGRLKKEGNASPPGSAQSSKASDGEGGGFPKTEGNKCEFAAAKDSWEAFSKAAEAKGTKVDIPIIKPEWKAVGMGKPQEAAKAEAEAGKEERKTKGGKKPKTG